jgi:hypothetical protein
MKKLLLPLFLILLLSCHTDNKSNTSNMVYICTGRYARAYHNTTDCRGIRACKAEIRTVTLEEAQKIGRTPCRYCYK